MVGQPRKRDEPWAEPPNGFSRVRDLSLPGVTFNRIVWSPDGSKIAAASNGPASPADSFSGEPGDCGLTVWDSRTGKLLKSFGVHKQSDVSWGKPHAGPISCGPSSIISEATGTRMILVDGQAVEVAPDGSSVVFGTESGELQLRSWFDPAGEPRRLIGHESSVESLRYSSDGLFLASVDSAGVLSVLHTDSWTRLTRRNLALDAPWSLQWWDRLSILVGHENGISLIDVLTGRTLVRVDHAAEIVTSLALSGDRKILAATGQHADVWLYRTSDWNLIAKHEGPINSALPGLAFHPTRPLLAAPSAWRGRLTIWKLDFDLLLGQAPAGSERYATARIALVGDSAVGKSSLGWRMAHGEFRDQPSTHGQQYWPVEALTTVRDDGLRCEAVLWDLAGQPDYRVVHALFLEDIDVALLLFDATDVQKPLSGPEYWLNQLRHGPRPPASVMLVGSRLDRGHASLTDEDLQAWCDAQALDGGYVGTSAVDGTGIDELLGRLSGMLRWQDMTTTISTARFSTIKDRIAEIARTAGPDSSILSFHELGRRLRETESLQKVDDVEARAAVRNLESHRYVLTLPDKNGEVQVLLAPEILVNLASSFVLEARGHPRGLGVLEEDRLLGGGYPFPELADMGPRDTSALLEAATHLFLRHGICFRETLGSHTLLVFPSLINERPPVEQTSDFVDDVAYAVSGAVEHVYPALVVLLGYTSVFAHSHHWRGRARYTLPTGQPCGFRLIDLSKGQIELVLEFHKGAPAFGRDLFRGLFESFLATRDVAVRRIPVVRCGRCAEQQERQAVVKQLDRGRGFIFCDNCGEKLDLPSGSSLELSTTIDSAEISQVRAGAVSRKDAEERFFRIKTIFAGSGRPAPTCFVSYAWGNERYERRVLELATDLRKNGVEVILDRWHCRPGDSLTEFVEQLDGADWVIAVGTPDYRSKHDDQSEDAVVRAEQKLIKTRLRKRAAIASTVIPVLFEGTKRDCFPPVFEDQVHVDMTESGHYFPRLEQLVLRLLGIPYDHPGLSDDALPRSAPGIAAGTGAPGR